MSERFVSKVSVLYTTLFRVTDSSGAAVTGLVNGDFTKLLYKDGVADGTTVTVTEIANGQYKATYTPATVGYWVLIVTNATYNPAGWQDDISVEEYSVSDLDPAVLLVKPIGDVEADMTTHRCLAGAIAVDVNRKVITGSTLSVKKVDDSTELFSAALTTSASQDPIVSVDPA